MLKMEVGAQLGQAPIASLIIEKYLTGQVNNTEREHFILSGNLMDKENEK